MKPVLQGAAGWLPLLVVAFGLSACGGGGGGNNGGGGSGGPPPPPATPAPAKENAVFVVTASGSCVRLIRAASNPSRFLVKN